MVEKKRQKNIKFKKRKIKRGRKATRKEGKEEREQGRKKTYIIRNEAMMKQENNGGRQGRTTRKEDKEEGIRTRRVEGKDSDGGIKEDKWRTKTWKEE